jgi:hypothetical protein
MLKGKILVDSRSWKDNIKMESKVFLHAMKTRRGLEIDY